MEKKIVIDNKYLIKEEKGKEVQAKFFQLKKKKQKNYMPQKFY